MSTEATPTSTVKPSAATHQALPQTEAGAANRAARAQDAREKAALLLREQKFGEAKRSLDEAEKIEAEGRQRADALAERENAATLMSEGKYVEARNALERADQLEAAARGTGAGPKKFFSTLRSRIREKTGARSSPALDPVAESVRVVSLYSKIAAGAGLVPGAVINFAAILAVQVVMVSRVAKAFGQSGGKDRIRGVILSLLGSFIPNVVGHGAVAAAIPALIAGTIVSLVATPVLAYALTRAVGNTFAMHFESGGTLLTFDPKKFEDYFLSEFQKAGGILRKADTGAPTAVHAEPQPATA